MLDIYTNLIDLLHTKEEAPLSQVSATKEQIKFVADRLRKDPGMDQQLDAAFAYYIAGYYVRASRLVCQLEPDEHIQPAQRWLITLLAKRFDDLDIQVQAICEGPDYHDTTISEGVRCGSISDDVALDRVMSRVLAEIMGHLIQFVKCGDECQMQLIRGKLDLGKKVAFKSLQSRWWWWLECTRLLLAEFVDNCLWTQLRSMRQEPNAEPLVSAYIEANYRRSNPVVELWRTQVESLPWVNDHERRSFCLAIPTSGGKTRVAELAILRFFLDHRSDPDAKCVYIAPFRRLAHEVEQTLSAAFSKALANPQIVSSFYGAQEVDPLDNEQLLESRVLIVTPEKLDGMLRQNPDLWSQMPLVIVDEGHMIGHDDDRGYRYRMLVERLVYSRMIGLSGSPEKPRILFISGVLPNADEFAEFIAGSKDNTVRIDWRPLEKPIISIWEWNGEELKTRSGRRPPPMPFGLASDTVTTRFEEIVPRVAFGLAIGQQTMVFSASKKAIKDESLLDLLAHMLEQQSLGRHPLPSGLARNPAFSKYYPLLERDVAIHHRDLPAVLKRETEARIDSERVRLLFASPTLAQGVNMPFSAVLVYRLHYYQGKPIEASTFWNVVGRVGRPIGGRGLDPPEVVFVFDSSSTQDHQRESELAMSLIRQQYRYRISSPFLGFLTELRKNWKQTSGKPIAELVSALAEKRDLAWIPNPKDQESMAKSLRLLDEHLTSLLEESGDQEQTEDWLQAVTARIVGLLVKATSIGPNDVSFIREAVSARLRFLAVHIPRSARRQNYLLGLPLVDCDAIRDKQEDLLQRYVGCTGIFAGSLDSGVRELVCMLSFICGLTICRRRWRADPFGNLPLVRQAMFGAWISGMNTGDIAALFANLHPKYDFEDYREQMFERSLPWGLSAICRFLDQLAQERGLRLTPDLQFLPSLVKYGVSGKLACYFARAGIGRESAVKIAAAYAAKAMSDDPFALAVATGPRLRAEYALKRLTEDEIISLHLGESAIQSINRIRGSSPTGNVRPTSTS